MEREFVIPKSYPTNLLKKNWTNRKCSWYVPAKEFMAKVHEMDVKEDDVWVVTLPKCGTTWMQELVWLVMNDFDFEAAKNEHLEVRTPFLEFDFLTNKDLNTAFRQIEPLKSPRLIKSHLPLPLLPAQLWEKKPKVIYVYRNPKDALISLFHHSRALGFELDKSLEEYLRNYTECGSLFHLPFEHVTEFYEMRNEPWVYYTSFERMKSNLFDVILNVCKFLDKNITKTQMQQMLKHLSFEEMKKNPKTNHHWEFDQVRSRIKGPIVDYKYKFLRKGQVNGYKEELSPEFIAEMDNWIMKNLTKLNYTLDELLLLEK